MRTFLVAFLFCSFSLASPSAFDLFHEANQAFDKGEYESAIRRYRDLITQGFDSADLHFNIANAYFKEKSIGRSIFHYLKALELSPRDPDIRFNLAYAKEKVVDQIENRSSVGTRLESLYQAINKKEAYYLLIVVMSLFFSCLSIELFYRPDRLRWARYGLILLVAFSLPAVVYHSFLRQPYGVVIVSEAKIYSGIGKDNVVLFTLHEGSELFTVEWVENDWVRIRLRDGKQGWIRSGDIVHERLTTAATG